MAFQPHRQFFFFFCPTLYRAGLIRATSHFFTQYTFTIVPWLALVKKAFRSSFRVQGSGFKQN
ncbi:hypothetical protein CROQUDRAFT_522528 [Cronartium quercuum f. sp. fusiforme G11]|uniref:Uncharacterized protein n=1 Tax=Cronartium quercuum f. sp. fusiforme G11 TaxID=708437 RepID=A0A9P6N826_9BASI|nr:hypothetical protein CROQUDRAFT_522528 [Cronartium quercuum f. sp. fusiforme G11]